MRRRFTIHKANKGFTPDNYLTIEAREDGLTASLSVNACKYCVDGDGNWKTLLAGTATESIDSGHTLSFRGNLTPMGPNGIGTFTINKKCNLKGNCMSMIFSDNAAYNYSLSAGSHDFAFASLFRNCSNIVSVSSNFLPATTISYGCYRNMFQNCTSLKVAPVLPASILENYCYSYMFQNCTNLRDIKMLATNISAHNCLYNWVGGVSSTGTFVKNAAMTRLPTGKSGIPTGWTVQNA